MMNPYIRFMLPLMLLSQAVAATNFVVTNTNDSGPGSLRQAITDANSGAGSDLITFSIPASDPGYNAARGAWILTPATSYPYFTGSNITVDGHSQALNQGDSNSTGPEIVIDGLGTLANAFILATPGNVIKGLCIVRCTYAIVFFNSTAMNNLVSGCYIGTDESGSIPLGNMVGIGVSGNAVNNTISDNLISGNSQAGIGLQAAGQTTIRGNKIGTDRLGVSALPNYYGIAVDNGVNVIIGGNSPADRNLISGNTSCGIGLNGSGTHNITVKGNYIGTDTSGTLPIPNDFGIILAGSPNNTIGGASPGEGNLISGNLSAGVLLNGSGTNFNSIRGNIVGLDFSGSSELHNHVGILLKSNAKNNIVGGPAAGDRNIISGNDEIGVYVEASDSNRFENNLIGPDITGMNPIMAGDSMFQGNGIELNTVSKYNVVINNVISGNRVYGFVFYGQVSYNDLTGNLIGTDITGNHAMKNATGICVDGASNHNNIIDNVLSGNLSYGIFIVTTGTYYNVVQGNMIGTNAAGTDSIPNDIGLTIGGGARYNVIGGYQPHERNIISGNRFDGIEIADNMTDYNQIIGNYVGTDISGTYAIPNVHGIGIATFPASNLFDGNLVSGNSQMGYILFESADSNRIINGKVGTDASGVNPLPNGLTGILLMEGANHNVIGGDTCGNIIAYNGNGGVVLLDDDTRFNTISGNAIHDNSGLGGIDIFPYGCNGNDVGDGDSGPNDMINYPAAQVVAYDSVSGQTAIWGTVDVPDADSAIVEVFIAQQDSLGCSEGPVYLGQCMVNQNLTWVLLTSALSMGDEITLTLTDKYGNTSEFAPRTNVSYTDGVAQHGPVNEEIRVMPNPFSDHFAVEFSGERPYSIALLDAFGRCITESSGLNDRRWEFNEGTPLGAGFYILRITCTDGRIVTHRLCKTQ